MNCLRRFVISARRKRYNRVTTDAGRPHGVKLMDKLTFIAESHSTHETKAWGRRLAAMLEGGELLGLLGDLGAGKTCFIKGLAHGLSLREEDILSPTFTMIQEHHGRFP